MKKFVVESDKESDSDEEVKKLEHADTDLDVELADTGSEEARAESEEGMACAETDTGETPEAETGVTPDTSTAAAVVEPPARRGKGRMKHRPLELIAEIDESLQDGKDSAVPAVTESPAGCLTRKKRAPGWMKNMLFFTLVCVVGEMVQADEMRGKYVTTKGAVFRPEGPARDLAEIKARVKRRRQEFRELERALKGDGTRRKRGLFDGGGQLINWLFGTATTKDLESVHLRLESFDKKGLEVVHLLQEQVTLLNVTMGRLSEHECEISALMAAAGQMRREQAQLRKVFNDSWTHLAAELFFLQKVTRYVEKANRALDWTADVLHGWQTGLADAAIGRLSPLLCPPNVLAKALNSVRQTLPQGWGLTPTLQGGNGWRAYQEARVEAALVNGNVRLFIHLPVFEFNYALQIYSVFPTPVATSKEKSVSHSYAGLAPYLGVSPDRQLFVEFNVDEVRKCTPYMGSVYPFSKPIDRKGRMKSCAAAVFLQVQEGIQRNCPEEKWTGIDLFYIGGRKWGYAGKDNVTIVLQCPGKRISGIGLPQVLPAAGVIKIPRLCSATSDEWVLQASFRQMMPVNVTSVIDEEAAGMLSALLAPVVEQS
ncbi:Uncharacterized protein APZ42_012763 [Daphnia magna]|uniref:Uncharacterized protein n=1 Tax=Daphnia magna TaxID=35525 RepID=A0A162RHX4_9CRUS|nr:Uncharacterized protein APZ42_012763 [Daphnia magna]